MLSNLGNNWRPAVKLDVSCIQQLYNELEVSTG